MICKNCGVESRDLFCPHCGHPLYEGLTLPPPVPVPAPEQAPITEQAPVTEQVPAAEQLPPTEQPEQQETPALMLPTEADKAADKQAEEDARPSATSDEPPKEEKKRTRRPPLRLSMIFWQAMALLLPLAYFFFDAFVVLSDRLFQSAPSGRLHLIDLMERLTTASYVGNTVAEVTESALGEPIALLQSVSLATLAADGLFSSAFFLPFAILLSFAAISALCGLLLLLTGGRILRWRAFCNLTLLGGTGAAVAPLLSLLAMRVSHATRNGIATADDLMLRTMPSFEYLCIMGILLCALLPAVASIKGLAAYARRQNGFLSAPFGSLEKRSFACKKVLALITALLLSPFLAALFLLPISPMGHLDVHRLPGELIALYNTLMGAKSAIDAGELQHLALADSLLGAALPLATAITLLCCLFFLLAFLRILFLRKPESAQKKGTKRMLKNVEINVRGGILAPYVSFVILQIVAVGFLLIGTPLLAHLNASNVDETLSVLYLSIAYVRTVGGTGTLYALIAAGAALLWYALGRSTDALWLSERKKAKKKKKKRAD